jgi:type IV secretion system protein VirD4
VSRPDESNAGWGPSHQTVGRRRGGGGPAWFWRPIQVLAALGLFGVVRPGVAIGSLVIWVAAGIAIQMRLDEHARRNSSAARCLAAGHPVAGVRAEARRLDGGVFLGVGRDRVWRLADREQAVMVLGPPRSGKSSAVIVPAVLAHAGAVVSTSTKPDVMAATGPVRSRMGTTWCFDPTGQRLDAADALRWSPVPAARAWDGALLMARSMVAGASVGAGTLDGTHWSKRASALLAALLHTAALSDQGIEAVVDWVLSHELDAPGVVLEARGARLACGVLSGLQSTEARERSSICSAAADALDAYTSEGALSAASDPNFDADRFVRGRDTVYVHAAAEDQALAAPLVCGLLADIRRATYRAYHAGELPDRVLFALDEVANIAPLAELPAIASEGGGQGLALLAAFQDLSQARARWREAADGFLTLFGAKLILPGVADSKTLETVSLAVGEYDRRMVSRTRRRHRDSLFRSIDTTVSTQRQRVLSAGEIANLPAGRALALNGVAWELIELAPAYRVEPWQTLTGPDRQPAGESRETAKR